MDKAGAVNDPAQPQRQEEQGSAESGQNYEGGVDPNNDATRDSNSSGQGRIQWGQTQFRDHQSIASSVGGDEELLGPQDDEQQYQQDEYNDYDGGEQEQGFNDYQYQPEGGEGEGEEFFNDYPEEGGEEGQDGPPLQTLFTTNNPDEEEYYQEGEEGEGEEFYDNYDEEEYSQYVQGITDTSCKRKQQFLPGGYPCFAQLPTGSQKLKKGHKFSKEEEGCDYEEEGEGEEMEEEEEEAVPDPNEFADKLQGPPRNLMGMKSFRYLEARVLANFIKSTEDERLEKIKAKFRMRQVSAPVDSLAVLHEGLYVESGSKEEMAPELRQPTIRDYTTTEWALKHAASFLATFGCTSPKESKTSLPPQEQSPILKLFLKPGGPGSRRRFGVGSASARAARPIDAPMKRRAERAVWRFIIENAKPKYPLPRFILPRYQFMRKVESELIGPGSYELGFNEKQRCRCCSVPSTWRSCTERFKKEGVEYAGSGIIPDAYSAWDKACERMKHPGTVTLFESTPCGFRDKILPPGSGLSPAHYHIPSPMDEFLKPKSLRGWFDHGSSADFCPRECAQCVRPKKEGYSLGPGHYNILDPNARCNKPKGHFSKTRRDKMAGFRAAYTNPLYPNNTENLPGPGTYSPYPTTEELWTENAWAAFNTGETGRKLDDREVNKLVAPDYYDYTPEGMEDEDEEDKLKHIFGGGCRGDFISGTGIGVGKEYAAGRERNRATRVGLDQEKWGKTEECVSKRFD